MRRKTNLMSGLELISIVIGFVLVYSLLSIIVTTIITMLAYYVNTRGLNLKHEFEEIFKADAQIGKFFFNPPPDWD